MVLIPFGPGRIGIVLFVGPGYPATRRSPVHLCPRLHLVHISKVPYPPSWLLAKFSGPYPPFFSSFPLSVVGYLGTLPPWLLFTYSPLLFDFDCLSLGCIFLPLKWLKKLRFQRGDVRSLDQEQPFACGNSAFFAKFRQIKELYTKEMWQLIFYTKIRFYRCIKYENPSTRRATIAKRKCEVMAENWQACKSFAHHPGFEPRPHGWEAGMLTSRPRHWSH